MNKAYWAIVNHFDLALSNDDFPFGTAEKVGTSGRNYVKIGEYKGYQLNLITANESDLARWHFVFLRSQIARPISEAFTMHRAVTLNHFLQTHQFCGKCGSKAILSDHEIAMICPSCQQHFYPVISPSIIVAVRRGKQILLANHQRHKGSIYTTLAGFIEAGESAEQAVEREVLEESGLKIKNIRYFGSQPWAFPNSLMLGFLADYESGEINLQEEEIFDAKWFDANEPLPELPPQGTIALQLIEETLKLCRAERA
nr:NAD(+) diphosphatase [uncultured Haemophilus sp.]